MSNQRESQIDHVIDRINSTPEPTQASVQKQVSPFLKKYFLDIKIKSYHCKLQFKSGI